MANQSSVAAPGAVGGSPDIERAVASLALTHGLLTPNQAVELIRASRTDGADLVELLGTRLSEPQLLAVIATEIGMRFYDLHSTTQEFRPDPATLGRCDVEILARHSALPLVDTKGSVVVAVANPADLSILDYLRSRFPQGMSLVLSARSQIQGQLAYALADSSAEAIEAAPTRATGPAPATPLPTSSASHNPVIEWVDSTLARAAAEGASDVHFAHNADKTLLLRFRVDGVLRRIQVPASLRRREGEVIGTLLNKCPSIDAHNQREPSDGTFSFTAAGRQIDARLAMLPQINGPTVVIRLLDSLSMRTRLDDMGFSATQLARMRAATATAQGTVLVSGPTGSGKTTTLYGLLKEVDALTKNVLTVEDPVEYRLPFINQTAIRSDLGDKSLTFARALRSILRLDPDVILVGECRDGETARVAMDAAITGHLVLTTIHSSGALGTYTRLIEMDLPAYLVAEAITLTIAQRLLRKVHDCATLGPPTSEERAAMAARGHELPDTVPHIRGCPGCNSTGYRGRIAAVEVLSPSRELKTLVAQSQPLDVLEAEARRGGFTNLFEDGLRHVAAGSTTVAEILRVLETDGTSGA